MTEKTHHVSGKKKDIAKNIQRLILEYPIIAAVNMEGLPAPQLQKMKAQLRGKIELTMTKRRIMKHAIEGIKGKKKNIELIEPYLRGMPALIFTKENPFSLFKTLKKSKTKAPAKAGQIAPFDIIVPKGPTSFMPGPVIGELAELGIKSGVENGKVAIKADSVAVKEGEKISAKAAGILTRLGINPMEVGLNVTAVYENGDIFTAKVLDIDEDKFKADLSKAVSGSFNLAINIGYPTKETINTLIGKAFNDAKALELSQNIIDEGIIDLLLSKAEGSALSLKGTANIETVEKPKVEKKKEKPKVEEKPKTEPPKAEEPKKEKVKGTPKSEEKPKVEEKPTPSEKKEEKVLEEEKEIIKEEKQLEKEANKPKIEDPVEKEVKEEVKEEEEKQLEKERIAKEKELEAIAEKKKAEEDEKKKAEEIKKLKEEAKQKEDALKQEEANRKAAEAKKAEEEKKKKEEEKKLAEEKQKAAEKAKEEQTSKEAVTTTDQKIAEMVAKTKKFVKGEIPNAEELIEEADKLAEEETKSQSTEPAKVKVKKVPKKVPTIQELSEKKTSQKSEISEGLETKSQSEENINKNKKEQEEVENLAQELIKKGTLRK